MGRPDRFNDPGTCRRRNGTGETFLVAFTKQAGTEEKARQKKRQKERKKEKGEKKD